VTALTALPALGVPRTALHRRRAPTGLLVVGDGTVRAQVDAMGWRRRRRIVGTVHPSNLEAATTEGWDELVVDGTVLDRFVAARPDLLRRARRTWVVPAPARPPEAVRLFVDPIPPVGRALKRALDVVLALLGLLLVLPVLAVAVVAVRFDSPGPALFRQVRVGANGRRFRLYKLRTMQHGNQDACHLSYVARLIDGTAERCDGLFKLTHDPRVTRAGRFLRRYSIDELPQLWNVVRGEMSLVGPRPPLPAEIEMYSAPAWDRLRVKPGLTGLWQVSGRAALSFDEMVSLDVLYWRQWSLRADAAILLRTPRTVLTGKGTA
jgi:lipopolysaccharide/colanic/teichoic acid biosynthesis glycosyltransferase